MKKIPLFSNVFLWGVKVFLPPFFMTTFIFMGMLSVSFSQNNLIPINETPNNQTVETASHALAEIMQNITLTQERVAELAKQVDGLKKDQKTLTAEMIKSAQLERQAANVIAQSEEKLAALLKEKEDVHKNLQNRRDEFSKILAALERMSINPPPAILMNPDDALVSVRSSVLLASLVPEMREKTKALSASLQELTRVSALIVDERETMKKQAQEQIEQKQRLALLLTEKAKLQKSSESELVAQRKTSEELAEKAKSLGELLEELQRQSRLENSSNTNTQFGLKRVTNFEALKGKLLLPVSGKRVQNFGAKNGAVLGETIETLPAAIVTSPIDAVVAYAGPFRSYGQLVILEVNQKYYILLAGMERIHVTQGQFVLSGEPLGIMGTQIIATISALDIGKDTPMLYIEFREQGKPINPAPWWRDGQLKRNENDA